MPQSNQSPNYIFVLGSHPQLSQLEINTLLRRFHLTPLSTPQLINPQLLSIASSHSLEQLINHLGGTVKIAVKIFQDPDLSSLPNPIINLIQTHPYSKLQLSSFTLPQSTLKNIAQEIKTKLKTMGVSLGYRLASSPQTSSGIDQKTADLIIESVNNQFIIIHTLSVQDINHWTQKDYSRPKSNPKSGMLPPKIARLMLNLSIPQEIDHQPRIYDPFCGTGTILTESLDLGFFPIGSDISSQAVSQATQNLFWFKEKFYPQAEFQVFHHDVHHLHPGLFSSLPDSIVFEGYLGPPILHPKDLKHQIKGLNALYKGALKKLIPLLQPQNLLVMALPEYHVDHTVKNLDSLVDTCENLGYTQLHSPLTYGRDEARVKRRIYLLQKN